MRLPEDHPAAVALSTAVHTGDLESLRRLLSQNRGLAAARIVNKAGGSGTPLHFAADWPGFFPGAPAAVAILIEAGADPDAALEGGRWPETPLHWEASSDDVEVARALLDGGARTEVTGASIADGTALDNAVGYACWRVAYLLVERGAQVTKLWQAAGLGMMPRVAEILETGPAPAPEDINDAFWQACNGGHRRVAEYLFALGADVDAVPDWAERTPLDVAGGGPDGPGLDTGREALVTWLREKGARSARAPG
jgi:ankyrin repeat protein